MEKRGKYYNALMAFVVFLLAAGMLMFYLRYEGRIVETYVMPEKPDMVLSVHDAVDIIKPQVLNTETEYKNKQVLVYKPDIPVSIVRITYSQLPEAFLSTVLSYVPYGKEDENPIERIKYVQKGSNEVLFAFPQVEFDTIQIKVHDIEDVAKIELYENGAYVDVNKTVPRTLNTGIVFLLAGLLSIVFLVSDAELRTGKRIGFPILYLLLEIAFLRYCLKTREYDCYNQNTEIGFYTVFTVVTVVLCITYRMLCIRKSPMHKVFMLSGMTMGIIMMLLIQPFGVPDEVVHYYQAYMRSNETLRIEQVNGDKNVIRWEDLRVNEKFHTEMGVRTLYQKYAIISQNMKLFNSTDEMRYFVREGKITSVPLGYVFSSLGITIGRLMNLSGLVTYYLGRFMNLLFYVAVVGLSVYLIPFGKTALMGMALTPIAMQQAASYSYDGIATALSFLFVSYILKLFAQSEQITLKQFSIFCILALVFAPSKAVYAPLVLMSLLIPAKKYGFGKHRWAYSFLIIAIGFGALFATQISNITRISGIDEVSAEGYTISYILANPLEIIHMVLATFENLTDVYLGDMFNQSFGWREYSGSRWLLVLWSILIVLGCQRCKEETLPVCFQWQRYGIMVVSLGVVMLTLCTLLMDNTPMGHTTIAGVQGRYFIPLTITLIPVLRNNQISMSDRTHRWCAFLIIWTDLYAVVDLLFKILPKVYF